MQLPLEISFRNMEPSPAIEARIHEKAAKLDRFASRVMRCRVVVEVPHRHSHKGKLYHVALHITLPGGEIVVNREGPKNHAHEDVYVAIRDGFDAAARQLEDCVRRMRGDVKTHETPSHGKVVRLFPEQGYGFIGMPDGLEVYFHKNSVADDGFEKLGVGSEVRVVIAEGEGKEGPQASTVSPVGKHHIVG
jgi:ribosomal subunit interface protein